MAVSSLAVHFLGQMPYEAAWDLQAQWAGEIAAGQRPPSLLLLEHPPTYTFGRRGQAEHLLWDAETLAAQGIAVHWVDRGGDVTYHGPGQLVGYPLLPLGTPVAGDRLPQADYVGYVRKLEQVLVFTLAEYGLVSGQLPGLTGVWVQPDVASRCPHCPPAARQRPAKIAAIGVKVDARGVSRHGFALNVQPEMSHWEGIVACGLPDAPVVSMADLLPAAPVVSEVAARLAPIFARVFGFHFSQDMA